HIPLRLPPCPPLVPYTTLFRSARSLGMSTADELATVYERETELVRGLHERLFYRPLLEAFAGPAAPRPGLDRPATEELLAGLGLDRKSTRLNSSHQIISYAVFC